MLLVVICAALVSILPSAGRAEPLAMPVSTVTVSLTDFGIRLSTGTVRRGRVTFRVTNRGYLSHSFAIAGRETRPLANGKRQAITVVLSGAGSYRFSSTMPGEAAIGMLGYLRVVRGQATRRQPVTTSSRLRLTRLASDLGALTQVVSPPRDEERMMVVQQAGRVLLFKNGVQQERPFLDLRSIVRAEGEGGLLSLTFAPDYAGSGLFYAFFTNTAGNIRVVEMQRSSGDADVADPASRRRVLAIQKFAPNHNGGMMQFGPDGYLYLSVGDGGANPPALPVGHFGQTISDLFSTILRIDHGTRPTESRPAIPSSTSPRRAPRSSPTAFATRGGSGSTPARGRC